MKKKGARSLCYCYCCRAFSTCLFLLSWWQKNGFGAFKKFEEDVAPFLLVFSSCHSDNKTDLELSRSLKEDEMNNRSKGDISLLSFQRRIERKGSKALLSYLLLATLNSNSFISIISGVVENFHHISSSSLFQIFNYVIS